MFINNQQQLRLNEYITWMNGILKWVPSPTTCIWSPLILSNTTALVPASTEWRSRYWKYLYICRNWKLFSPSYMKNSLTTPTTAMVPPNVVTARRPLCNISQYYTQWNIMEFSDSLLSSLVIIVIMIQPNLSLAVEKFIWMYSVQLVLDIIK